MSDAVKKYVFGRQIKGERSGQEDEFDIRLIDERDGSKGLLLVLADGMGGYAGGAMASRTAILHFVDRFMASGGEVNARLQQGLEWANQQIAAQKQENARYAQMGCTLVAAYIASNRLYWVSVGDSMLYLYRGAELLRLNEDHSMAPVLEGMVDIGRMTAQEAASDGRRNQLRSVVSGEEISLVNLPEEPMSLYDGDYLLLASDGLQSVPDQELGEIIRTGAKASMEDLTTELIVAVKDKCVGNQDNTSLILYCHEYPDSVNLPISDSESEPTLIIRR